MLPLSQVPAIRAAIEDEAETRDTAFLEAACDIVGVTVLPLSLRRYLLLCASRNAFVTGGALTPEAAAQFLWCVSDRYNTEKAELPQFITEIAGKNYGDVLAGISGYLAFSFFDAPPAPGDDQQTDPPPSFYSFATHYVDLLGKEYGWTFRDTLDVPLPVIFQLIKRIQQRNDPRTILFNPLSDRAKADFARNPTP